MKVVILAGGKGSRLQDVSKGVPKPMVRIGGKPILWHIMSHYASYGYKEFVVCLGYKGHQIKDFFLNYSLFNCDLDIDLGTGNVKTLNRTNEDWSIKLIDTGLETMTGGRVKQVQDIVGRETFFLTYGDALSNVNINSLLKHHKEARKVATVTAVTPQGRFGVLNIDKDSLVRSFVEKPSNNKSKINGGFFVLEPEIFDHITGDDTIFEHEPLENLAKTNNLNAFVHPEFWQCMDTPRDWELLERLATSDTPPWSSI